MSGPFHEVLPSELRHIYVDCHVLVKWGRLLFSVSQLQGAYRIVISIE
jgi:hypothetical protein